MILTDINGLTVSGSLSAPEITTLQNGKLNRNGSQSMGGTLDMSGNDIADVGTINASQYQQSGINGILGFENDATLRLGSLNRG